MFGKFLQYRPYIIFNDELESSDVVLGLVMKFCFAFTSIKILYKNIQIKCIAFFFLVLLMQLR